MSDKKVKSFTVDEDIADELSARDEVNASQVVNNYLRQFLDATDRTESEAIIAEINRQIEDVDDELEKLQNKRSNLVDRRERIKEQTTEKKQEAIDALSNIPKRKLTVDNPAVQNWVDKTGMSAKRLVELVEGSQ